MKTLAAVLVQTGMPLELMDLDIPVLKAGQVLVEIAYSGVCHTQLLEARGHRGQDRYLPHCLGHEGTGRVLEVGTGVVKVKPGDRVVISWIKGSGCDVPGTVYRAAIGTVNAGAVTTFSRMSVVSENRLTVLASEMDMRVSTLLGCALPTGVGAVVNTGQARPGMSVAIFGVGGVGMCALMGAISAGCCPIIVIDRIEHKLQIASTLGADYTIQANDSNVIEKLRSFVPGGVDLAIEATGRTEVMTQAIESVRSRGGTAVVIGNARYGEKLKIDPALLNQGKNLLGTWGGDTVPDRDIPRIAAMLHHGRISPEPLIEREFKLERINDALDELESSRIIRPLVKMAAN
ncbi:MAG: zinc-binding dehydrogenase [Phycisphaera sp.]|nr:zinc-binding dehydrogenase [Phycisphaera sp.]